jgi:hypothetical protein
VLAGPLQDPVSEGSSPDDVVVHADRYVSSLDIDWGVHYCGTACLGVPFSCRHGVCPWRSHSLGDTAGSVGLSHPAHIDGDSVVVSSIAPASRSVALQAERRPPSAPAYTSLLPSVDGGTPTPPPPRGFDDGPISHHPTYAEESDGEARCYAVAVSARS